MTLSVQHRVADVLFRYRNLPHTTTARTPSELFLKRAPRTRLSLVKPSLQKRVEDLQCKAKMYVDGPRNRRFDLFQKVKVRNIRGGKEKWISGVVVEIN